MKHEKCVFFVIFLKIARKNVVIWFKLCSFIHFSHQNVKKVRIGENDAKSIEKMSISCSVTIAARFKNLRFGKKSS